MVVAQRRAATAYSRHTHVTAATSAVTARWRRLLHQLMAWREVRRSGEAQAICPVDSWAFRPRYTEGHCPICGWQPPGAVVRLPLSRRVDAFAWMVLAAIAVSLVMAILVALLYARG